MNVLVADNHGIIRLAMCQLIKDIEPTGKVYEATTYEETIDVLNTRILDLLIVDVNMSDTADIRMIGAIKATQPGISLLVFSAGCGSVYAAGYFKAGADGYLKKDAPASEIRSVVKAMMAGRNYRRRGE